VRLRQSIRKVKGNFSEIMHYNYALHKKPEKRAGCHFLRLAFLLGFVGLMSEIFRISSSNRNGCFPACVFTLLASILPLLFTHQKPKVILNHLF
jgi:hypothetical protein